MRVFIFIVTFLTLVSCSKDSRSDVPNEQTTPIFLGEIDWIKSFGGAGEDTARSIISTSDGGYAVFGYTNSIDGDITDKSMTVVDYWLLKLDEGGNIQWSKTYGGSGEDKGQSVIQTSDGGYALTGYAQSADGDGSNNEGFHDNWIIRLDIQGNILWERSFGFSGHDHSYDIIQTDDGGLFFTGHLDITAARADGFTEKGASLTRHGVGEFWGTKLDSNGDIEWRSYFGGSNNDRAFGVVQAEDGGFVMTGFSESDDFDVKNNQGSYDFWVVKINDKGELLWENTYGGSEIDRSYSIVNTADGGYAITGQTLSSDSYVGKNNGESDFWLIKLNGKGELVWENSFGGSGFELAEGMTLLSDGGFMIVGNSKSSDGDTVENAGENDIWIVRTDAKGQLEWQRSIGGSDLDFGFDILENRDGSIMVVGETASQDFLHLGNRGLTDAVIMKLK